MNFIYIKRRKPLGKVDERNQNVSNILNSLIAKAKATTYTVDETSYKTSKMGIRDSSYR